MRLKNVLLVIADLERSKKFYQHLFGLRIIADLGGNVILTEGLVLQERQIWKRALGKPIGTPSEVMELYFETDDLEEFLKKAKDYSPQIRILSQGEIGGRRMLRLYDPDGHLIEVKEGQKKG